MCQLGNEIAVTHCDTIQHCNTSVTPKVIKFSGTSDDGRRHGRSTYLFWEDFVFDGQNSNSVTFYTDLFPRREKDPY
jgi:hypothetical protein